MKARAETLASDLIKSGFSLLELIAVELATILAGEKIFYAEFNSYTTRLDTIGFDPVGRLEANIGFAVEFYPPLPAKQGTPGCQSTCGYGDGCPRPTWTCAEMAKNSNFDVDNFSARSTASTTSFDAEAHFHYERDGNGFKYITIKINQNHQFFEAEGYH